MLSSQFRTSGLPGCMNVCLCVRLACVGGRDRVSNWGKTTHVWAKEGLTWNCHCIEINSLSHSLYLCSVCFLTWKKMNKSFTTCRSLFCLFHVTQLQLWGKRAEYTNVRWVQQQIHFKAFGENKMVHLVVHITFTKVLYFRTIWCHSTPPHVRGKYEMFLIHFYSTLFDFRFYLKTYCLKKYGASS